MKNRTVSEHTLKGDGGGIEESIIPAKESDVTDTSNEVSERAHRHLVFSI